MTSSSFADYSGAMLTAKRRAAFADPKELTAHLLASHSDGYTRIRRDPTVLAVGGLHF